MNNGSSMQHLWQQEMAPKHSAWKLTQLTPWLSAENASAPGYLASQKPEDPGLWRAVQEGGKLKMAEVDQEMMLLILFSSSPGGNHENWALVVSVIAGNVVIWGSCSPKLLGEDSRERMGDSDQPVAEMCSCLQISAWLKNGTFPCHASKQAI